MGVRLSHHSSFVPPPWATEPNPKSKYKFSNFVCWVLLVIMALEFVGGPLFTLLYDGVKKALSKSRKFKSLLGDLKSTLDSLVGRDIQQIGEHNIQLDLPNEEIEDLKTQMEEGVRLVEKLSNFRIWNCYCLNDYSEQIVELDRALKGLLRKLELQEARDVKEVLLLARQNRDKLDEVNRRLLDIKKFLQEGAGDVMESSVSGGNAETVQEESQGNGEQPDMMVSEVTVLGPNGILHNLHDLDVVDEESFAANQAGL